MSKATLTVQIPTDGITVVAAPPDLLSQHNVEAATGIPARTFIELIRAPAFPVPVSRIGKLRLVDRGGFLEWVRALGRRRVTECAPANTDEDVEALATEMGVEDTPRKAHRRRRRV